MKDKRGITFTTLLMIIIALAVFVLLVTIFFLGPGSLFNAVKKVLPRADTFIKRGTGETADYEQRAEREQVENAFGELMNEVLLLKEGMAKDGAPITDACLHFIGTPRDYKRLFDGYEITLTGLDDGIRARLDPELASAQRKTDSDLVVGVSNVKLEGLKPCLVTQDAAKTFYQTYLEEGQGAFDPADPPTDYSPATKITLHHKEIISGGEEMKWQTAGGPLALYIHDDHLCLFPTFRRGGCRYNENKGLLNDDCFDDDRKGLQELAKRRGAYILNEATGMCESTS